MSSLKVGSSAIAAGAFCASAVRYESHTGQLTQNGRIWTPPRLQVFRFLDGRFDYSRLSGL